MNLIRDLHHLIKPVLIENTAVFTGNVVTNVIDTQGFSALEFIIQSGTITTGTFTPLIEVSNNSDMSGAISLTTEYQLLGTIAGATFSGSADSNKIKTIGAIIDIYRYVRLTLVGSNTPNGQFTIAALQAGANLVAEDNPNPN